MRDIGVICFLVFFYLRGKLIFFGQQSWVHEALFPTLSSVSPAEEDKHFTILSDWNTEAKIEK